MSGAPNDKRSRLAGQGLGGGGSFWGVGGRGRARLGGTHRSWLGGRGVREAGQARGGCKGFGSGGVGGRDTGARDGAIFVGSHASPTKRRKMAVFEGCRVGWRGGTHRSWPGGRGGRPRALFPGEGLAWRAKAALQLAWWTGGQGSGARAGGGARASVPGG